MARTVDLSEEMKKWAPARLIPTTGIRGQQEQEIRATSVLLAVMHAVPEFAAQLLTYGKAPAGKFAAYETFTEVALADAVSGDKVRPDGAIVVRRGKTVWRCLVEVKTGRAALSATQIEQYVRVANQLGFDAVMTISNEIASSAGECPVRLDRRLTRSVTLFHLSWFRILTEAVLAHVHRGVSDPDQAWILAELIAYLRHPKSGAGDFEDMGPQWTKVRDGARHRTLRAADAAVREVARHWEEFIQYLCLQLCQHLGRDVDPIYPRKIDRAARLAGVASRLAETGTLKGSISVPDAVGPVTVEADLQARMVTIGTEVTAPNEGRPKTRINWMLRQLKEAPDDLRVEVAFARVRHVSASLLHEVRAAPEQLLLAADPKREPRHFALALGKRMGLKRGKGLKSFVAETENQLFEFYGQVVQGVTKWTPRAPRLPTDREPTQAEAVPAPSPEAKDPDGGPASSG